MLALDLGLKTSRHPIHILQDIESMFTSELERLAATNAYWLRPRQTPTNATTPHWVNHVMGPTITIKDATLRPYGRVLKN